MESSSQTGGPAGRQSDCWGVSEDMGDTAKLLPMRRPSKKGGDELEAAPTEEKDGGDVPKKTARDVHFRGALMLTLKSFVGAGVLGMPFAFKCAGFAVR